MKESQRYWLRTAGLAAFAVLVSIVVSAIAQNRRWPHPESIAFGAFIFLLPVLQAAADRRRVTNWPLRLVASVGLGLVAGLLYAFVVER